MSVLDRCPALQAWRAPLKVTALVFAFSWGFGEVRTRTGWDDTYYLLQASSLVEDGDLDLRNDALHSQLTPRDLQTFLTATVPSGSLKNTFSIGPAALWLPAYVAALPLRPAAAPPAVVRRWSRAQLAALHLLSLAFLAGIACFLVRLLESTGSDPRLALLATVALLAATPLAVYGPAVYTMAHLPSALATCLFVACLLWLEREVCAWDRSAGRHPGAAVGCALLAGVALGLVFLVRWQDAVFALLLWVPLAPLLVVGRRALPRLALLLAAVAAGGAVVASLQLHAWHLEYGSWLTVPQGEGYMRWTAPRLADFLLSGHSGLLTWSPLFALAAAGLLLPWRCRLSPHWRIAALAVLAVEVYLSAAVRDWWGGHSFGARRMTSCVPLLAIGLANLAAAGRAVSPIQPAPPSSRLGRRALIVALAALCGWGCFVANLYWRQVQDLSLVVRGVPSSGGAEGWASGVVDDPAEARARALRSALGGRLHNYFAGLPGVRRSLGVALTLTLMGTLLAGTCCLLLRLRGPLVLRTGLLAVAGIALVLQGRLALGPHPEAGERAAWQEIAEQWNDPRHRFARPEAPSEGPRSALASERAEHTGLADAYRYLAMLESWEAGEPRQARRLLDQLAGSGYPAAAALRRQVAGLEGWEGLERWQGREGRRDQDAGQGLEGRQIREGWRGQRRSQERSMPGGELLRLLPGAFFEPSPGRSFRTFSLPAASAAAGSLDVAFDLRSGDLESNAVYDVVTLQDGNRSELARVSLRGPDERGGGSTRGRDGAASRACAVLLVTRQGASETAWTLGGERWVHMRLRYERRDSVASLVVAGPAASLVRLSTPLAPGSAAPAALGLGRDRLGHASFPLWSWAFSDLSVVAAP
ncbi:MAG TPA: hypothetical protein VHR45_08040 [Thermoanaerobaculia bacterium]|nr:hypothetical protein [Thermoanaerobaculia bacterium]